MNQLPYLLPWVRVLLLIRSITSTPWGHEAWPQVKRRTLLSVFMVPVADRDATLPGRRVSYRDHDYMAYEHKGFRTVSWVEGHAVYGLVSILDYDALLECADRLRAERTRQTRI
jgi:hypothetical protein